MALRELVYVVACLAFTYCVLVLPAALIFGEFAFAGLLAVVGTASALYLWSTHR